MMVQRQEKRAGAIKRIRSKFGYGAKHEVLVFVSSRNIYAQVIELGSGKTLFTVSTLSKGNKKNCRNIENAQKLGAVLALKCKEANIEKISFNRAEKIFHGVVKALADSFYGN